MGLRDGGSAAAAQDQYALTPPACRPGEPGFPVASFKGSSCFLQGSHLSFLHTLRGSILRSILPADQLFTYSATQAHIYLPTQLLNYSATPPLSR